ncbi:MAG: DUF5667 domain-containing protein [Chloroflexota bacterium]
MSMKETRPMDASNEPRVDQIPEPILDPEIEGMLATMHRLPVRNRQAAAQGRANFLAEAQAIQTAMRPAVSPAVQPVAEAPMPTLTNPVPNVEKAGASLLDWLKNLFDAIRQVFSPQAYQPSYQYALRFAVILILILSLGLISSTSIVNASQRSLPGDLLYPVKTTLEQTQLVLSNDEQRVVLHAEFAERRVQELQSLVAQERYADLETAVEGLNEHVSQALGEMESSSSSTSPVINEVNEMVKKQIEDANVIIEALPTQVPRPVIEIVPLPTPQPVQIQPVQNNTPTSQGSEPAEIVVVETVEPELAEADVTENDPDIEVVEAPAGAADNASGNRAGNQTNREIEGRGVVNALNKVVSDAMSDENNGDGEIEAVPIPSAGTGQNAGSSQNAGGTPRQNSPAFVSPLAEPSSEEAASDVIAVEEPDAGAEDVTTTPPPTNTETIMVPIVITGNGSGEDSDTPPDEAVSENQDSDLEDTARENTDTENTDTENSAPTNEAEGEEPSASQRVNDLLNDVMNAVPEQRSNSDIEAQADDEQDVESQDATEPVESDAEINNGNGADSAVEESSEVEVADDSGVVDETAVDDAVDVVSESVDEAAPEQDDTTESE